MAEVSTSASPLQRVLNFRDVGNTVNTLSDEPVLKPGLFYRSGLPDDATPLDRLKLQTEYSLKTIIDLRTDSEHVEQVRKNAAKIPSSPVAEPKDPAKALRIPGVEYKYINLNGHAYSSALIKQLSYWNAAKLFTLYVLGYRTHAISILGENVMAKRGLEGLAEDSLQHCTAEVKSVFDILSDERNYPVLVHCTQGKDRTGLVVLLLLRLCGVKSSIINQDYMMSAKELEPEREKRLVEIRGIGLPDDFAGCAEAWVEGVVGWLEREHGGIEQYLKRCCGVTDEQMKAVRGILLQE